ncbi:MAG TPA: coniferyl aldehyde dehydrogenase [Steroidobacteraceae bacterium]|nr:coniferyl aldehyde dehydrogenase [Steroidobacteraceae bacterium]
MSQVSPHRASPAAASASPEAAALLERQRAAFMAEGAVTARVRLDRLGRTLDLLVTHQQRFCEAVAEDYGKRPPAVTLLMDVYPAVQTLRHARRSLRRWMRPRRVSTGLPLGAPGTSSEILYQPLGVVGIISPWNFPVALSFGPLASVLAAGNRCLIKPSEVTAATTALMQELVARYFDPSEVAVVSGGPEVAEAFSRLPFDHLMFTGSTAVGRKVMEAAAQHLVPVTLELGGKCPVIIGRSADPGRAADRILLGKLANAGQICLAPDHVFVPRESLDPFVRAAQSWMRRAYPAWATNPDYTSLVSAKQAARARELLADAIAKGAKTIALDDVPGTDDERRFAPAFVLDPTENMRIMQEEIFAPLLPVIAYDSLEGPLAEINRRERPLAIYYFGTDERELRQILDRTVSGAVTVNDIAAHFMVQNLPFGGVGASGMGAYHGEQGFRQFSHARAVFRQTRLDIAGLIGLRPPYGARLRRFLGILLRR